VALGAGVVALQLTHGLRRGRRRAWRAAVLVLPVGAAAAYGYQGSPVGALISLTLLCALLRHRDRFTAPPGPRSRWRALAHLVLMGAGSVLLGLLIVSAHPHRVVGDPSLADRLTHALYGLFGVEGPVAYRGPASATVARCLGTLGLLTALTTLHLVLRPRYPAVRPSRADAARLRALLAEHGCPARPLGRDGRVVFSPSGRAAVTYRVVSGVMLAAGDPVGDAEAWPGAIERFMDEARAHAWVPAVTGCSDSGGAVWARETGLLTSCPAPPGPTLRA
jgi:lysyl-tRNA synthetase class 2